MFKYRKSYPYKYKTTEAYTIITNIHPSQRIETPFILLTVSGELNISNGYAWDGASGTFDTKTIMRGSLVHDVLYQLMRQGFLDKNHRKDSDKFFRKICIEDGMNRAYAWIVYHSVRVFGGFAIKSENE